MARCKFPETPFLVTEKKGIVRSLLDSELYCRAAPEYGIIGPWSKKVHQAVPRVLPQVSTYPLSRYVARWGVWYNAEGFLV